MAQPTASGSSRDREYKSFVESPSRGSNFTAQETYVGNGYDSPVPVDLTDRGETKLQYNEVNSTGIETIEIINLTVPIGKGWDLQDASVSGDNRSVFTIEVNSSVVDKKRIYYTKFNTEFNFKNYGITEGDNLKIIVENKTNSAATFNANIKYSEYDL